MEVSSELMERVLRFVNAEGYKPLKAKSLASKLELPAEDYRELRRVIKWLAHHRKIAFGSNHLIRSLGSEAVKQFPAGIFRRAAGGFGFVRPTTPIDDSSEDLYVPEGRTLGAFDGDLVEVSMQTRGRRPGTEAHVVRIIERARRQFTGTFARQGKEAVVYLDGTPYDMPVSVGDVRGLPVNNDDKVFVELVRFPAEDGSGGEGVLLEVLGSSRNPAVDTLSIMRQFGLSESFPDEVLDAARQQADAFNDQQVPEDRTDYADLVTVTIDPADARDFDDAISLRRNEVGHWELFVHIADVAHFVPEGSALDSEAKRRATSVYLPDRVVPMLPEIISNHLASLQPDRVRLAKTVRIEMNDDGLPIHSEVINSAIRSNLRLTYEQVDQYLAEPAKFVDRWGKPICELLTDMHRLAMRIRQRRVQRGALELELPEIKIELDRMGKVCGAHLTVNTESHQVIEEFMLAANQAVASWLDELEFPFLHRIHPPPQRRKLIRTARFARELGIRTDDVTSRFGLQKLLRQTKGTPLELAIHFAVLRSMSKAVYGPDVEGHYALDFEHYCHFTSPIRRYPDLTVHRLVQRILEKRKQPADSLTVLGPLGVHCSDKEQQAEQAERELVKLKLLHYLQKKVGTTMEGVIVNVNQDGFFVRGRVMPAEGFVSIASLPRDSYQYERRGHSLNGYKARNQFRLGDRVQVRIDRVDMRAREAFFVLCSSKLSSQ
jgi:ribonuclease R